MKCVRPVTFRIYEISLPIETIFNYRQNCSYELRVSLREHLPALLLLFSLVSPNVNILILNFAAVFFLEYWKRKEITLAYQWDVLGFEEEEVRYIRIPMISFNYETELIV